MKETVPHDNLVEIIQIQQWEEFCYTKKKGLVYSHQLLKITHVALSIIQFKFGKLSYSILRYFQ